MTLPWDVLSVVVGELILSLRRDTARIADRTPGHWADVNAQGKA